MMGPAFQAGGRVRLSRSAHYQGTPEPFEPGSEYRPQPVFGQDVRDSTRRGDRSVVAHQHPLGPRSAGPVSGRA